MTLDHKAKEYVLKYLKMAIDDLQNQSFDGLRKLVPRLVTTSEVFPDEVWTKELSLMALVCTVIGASTEAEIPRTRKEYKDGLVKKYSEKLGALYGAIEEENIGKIDSFLKEFAILFFSEIGL